MGQIRELVGLRGVLAWWVVGGHLAYVFSQRIGELSFNRSAVDVFIVLSGFVIMSLLDTKQEPFRPYIARRFMRLFPIYVVILFVSAATLAIQQYGLAHAPFETERTAARIAALQAAQSDILLHMAAHLPMLHGLVPTALISKVDTSIIGQAWSISVEWQFYLVAPLVYWGLTGDWRARLSVIAGALVLFALSKVGPLSSNDAFIGGSVGWFAVGIFSYFGFKARERPWPVLVMMVGAALLAGFGVVAQAPGAVLWAGVMLWLIGRVPKAIKPIVEMALTNRVAMTLGNISYSTYVVHMLVIYLSMAALNKMQIASQAYGPLLIIMTIAGTAGLSFLGYYCVEKPGIDVGAQLARGRRGVLSAKPAR